MKVESLKSLSNLIQSCVLFLVMGTWVCRIQTCVVLSTVSTYQLWGALEWPVLTTKFIGNHLFIHKKVYGTSACTTVASSCPDFGGRGCEGFTHIVSLLHLPISTSSLLWHRPPLAAGGGGLEWPALTTKHILHCIIPCHSDSTSASLIGLHLLWQGTWSSNKKPTK